MFKKSSSKQRETTSTSKIRLRTMRQMFVLASLYVDNQEAYLNKINVFPVPDGDTGSNMSYTMKGIKNELQKRKFLGYRSFVRVLQKASLLYSRGNSGTVLSQFFIGFSCIFAEKGICRTKEFVQGFCEGWKKTGTAFQNPISGTVLDVITATWQGIDSAKNETKDIVSLLQIGKEQGEKALQQTREIIKKRQGKDVPDAAGVGFLCIIEGFLVALQNQDVDFSFHHHTRKNLDENSDTLSSVTYDTDYRFCTECIVVAKGKNIPWKEKMSPFGGSLQIVQVKEFVKIHIHTNTPQKVKDEMQKLGHLHDWKVDDMREKTNEIIMQEQTKKDDSCFHRLITAGEKKDLVIVVDDSADIPDERFDVYPIVKLPIHIIDRETKEDFCDKERSDFYTILATSKKTSWQTAQPTREEIKTVFKKALEVGSEVLYLAVSAKVSGSYAAAVQVASELSPCISVVDTKMASGGIAFCIEYVLKAMMLKQQNLSLYREIEHLYLKIDFFYFPKTLDFLHRGGRIDKKKYFLGKMLYVSPVITVVAGKVVQGKKIFFASYAKQEKYILTSLRNLYNDGGSIQKICFVFSDDETHKKVFSLQKKITDLFSLDPLCVSVLRMTKTLGVHLGPGSWGVVMQR